MGEEGNKEPFNLVVVDSNFILLPFQYKINYFEEIEFKLEGSVRFIIYQQVLDELNSKRRRWKGRKFALQYDAGLRYLEEMKSRHDIRVEPEERKRAEETTDEFLLRKVRELKLAYLRVFLATNDKRLRQQAREIKVNLIYLRQEKKLEIDFT
ncbi:MAG: type II toxin-antitoxin system VapC family toxin [Promethearchaeota archaeon]